jgi:hypothetical protein
MSDVLLDQIKADRQFFRRILSGRHCFLKVVESPGLVLRCSLRIIAKNEAVEENTGTYHIYRP